MPAFVILSIKLFPPHPPREAFFTSPSSFHFLSSWAWRLSGIGPWLFFPSDPSRRYGNGPSVYSSSRDGHPGSCPLQGMAPPFPICPFKFHSPGSPIENFFWRPSRLGSFGSLTPFYFQSNCSCVSLENLIFPVDGPKSPSLFSSLPPSLRNLHRVQGAVLHRLWNFFLPLIFSRLHGLFFLLLILWMEASLMCLLPLISSLERPWGWRCALRLYQKSVLFFPFFPLGFLFRYLRWEVLIILFLRPFSLLTLSLHLVPFLLIPQISSPRCVEKDYLLSILLCTCGNLRRSSAHFRCVVDTLLVHDRIIFARMTSRGVLSLLYPGFSLFPTLDIFPSFRIGYSSCSDNIRVCFYSLSFAFSGIETAFSLSVYPFSFFWHDRFFRFSLFSRGCSPLLTLYPDWMVMVVSLIFFIFSRLPSPFN